MNFSYTNYRGVIVIFLLILLASQTIYSSISTKILSREYNSFYVSNPTIQLPFYIGKNNSILNITDSLWIVSDISPFDIGFLESFLDFQVFSGLENIEQPKEVYVFAPTREGELYMGGRWLRDSDILEWINSLVRDKLKLEEVIYLGSDFLKGAKGRATQEYLQKYIGATIRSIPLEEVEKPIFSQGKYEEEDKVKNSFSEQKLF